MSNPINPIRGVGRAATGAAVAGDRLMAQRILAANTQRGARNVVNIEASLGQLAKADPAAAARVRTELERSLTPVERGELARAATPAQAGPSAGEIANTVADVTQIGLDIAGIFDPTPISDGSNAVISLVRGDFLGAGLSAVSIFPYVGDLAKLGKLGAWAQKVEHAVELTTRFPAARRALEPVLQKLSSAIGAAPKAIIDKLPKSARDTLTGLKRKIDDGLAPRKPVAEEIVWPPNRGFLGPPHAQTLKPGARIDRYGFDGGTFLSPVGTLTGARALAPGTTSKPYSVFEVVKPLDVQAGKVAPWFGEVGHGTQYELPMSVTDAMKAGLLKRVSP